MMNKAGVDAIHDIPAEPCGEGIGLRDFRVVHVARVAIDEITSPMARGGCGDGFEFRHGFSFQIKQAMIRNVPRMAAEMKKAKSIVIVSPRLESSV